MSANGFEVSNDKRPYDSKRKGYAYRIRKLLPYLIKKNESLSSSAYNSLQNVRSTARNAGYFINSLYMESIDQLDDFTTFIDSNFEEVKYSLHLADCDFLKLIDKQLTDTLTKLNVSYSVPELGQVVDMRSNQELDKLYKLMDEGSWDVDSYAAKLHENEKQLMDYDHRIELINYIGNGFWVTDEDESTILDLIKYTPGEDYVKLFNDLTKDQLALIKLLHSKLQSEENAELHNLLHGLFMYKDGLKSYTEKFNNENMLIFPWADPGLISLLWKDRFSYNVSLTDAGKVKIRYTAPNTGLETGAQHVVANAFAPGLGSLAIHSYNLFMENFHQSQIEGDIVPSATTYELDPFDMIKVRFYHDEEHLGQVEGAEYIMPALSLMTLEHSQFMNDLGKLFDLGMLTLGVVTGIGAIGAASKIGKIIAAADILFALGDAIIKEFRFKIAQTAGGRAFLAVWDGVSMAFALFGIAQLVKEGGGLIKKLHDTWYDCASDVKGVIGKNADIIEGQVNTYTNLAGEIKGNEDLRRALAITQDAKLNHNLDNVEDLIRNDIGEEAYNAIKPKLDIMSNELDELQNIAVTNSRLVGRRQAFSRLEDITDSGKFFDKIEDVSEQSYETLKQVIANTSDEALETTLKNINMFEDLEYPAKIVDRFDDVEEGTRFINFLENSEISKIKGSQVEKAVHRKPFYKAYKRFKNGEIPGKPNVKVDHDIIVDVPEGATIINAQHAGSTYKGVEFNRQGFPMFETEFRVEIDEMFYMSTDDVQFAIGNELLYETIQDNSKLVELLELSPDDIAGLKRGLKPEGYIWHHNQNTGILELVDKDTHEAARHLGGRNIWGGGQDYRK